MPFQTDNILPSGGMNKDIDLSLIPAGDYVDALDIQHLTDGGSTSFAIQNTKGNVQLVNGSIGSVTAQNKRYRILMQVSAGTLARQVTIYDAQGVSIAVVGWVDNATTIATSYSNFTTALATAIAATTPLQTDTVSLSGSYAIFTLTTVAGFEYSVKDTQGTNATTVEVTREAIDQSLVGEANVIGSYDLLGQLYVWSTSQVNLPSVLGVTLTESNVSGALIRITTSAAHGLATGQSIVISGAAGAGAASTNGIWIVTVINSTSFDLQNSVWVSNTIGSASIITINVEGIGEIGVVVFDANKETGAGEGFTYTRLIRSKELNFRRSKQIDTYCEQNNFETSLYWTDDYNVPRVLYYSGAIVTDGAIEAIIASGKYAYGSINEETRLVLTNELIGFAFTRQIVSGGSVMSGNWRYAVRLLTDTFSATNWTEISNPINVFKSDPSLPLTTSGDDALVVTPKINEFQVTNLTIGLFKYIELAAVNYVNGAIVGSIVNRFIVSGSTMTIQHTGNETNVVNLDVATLNQFSFDIQTAKNIDAIDNRLILSNLTTGLAIDFSAWTQTWKHSILQDTIDAVRLEETNYRFGEYMDPLNVYNKMGYMYNETYRVSAKFRLKNNSTTNNFWIDDITIDDSTPTRRNVTLTNFNLTTNGGDSVYVPYIRIEPQSFDFLIGGVPARDLIAEIIIERVECVPEILFSGVAVMGVDPGPMLPAMSDGESVQYPGSNIGEYPFAVSAVNYTWPAGSSPYDVQPLRNRNFCALYSPDWIYGNNILDFEAGDTVINFGNPEYRDVHFANLADHSDHYDGVFMQYSGYLRSGISHELKNVVDTKICLATGTVSVGGSVFSKGLVDGRSGGSDIWHYMSGPVMKVQPLSNLSSQTDYGIYNIQYKRSKTNKYGDVSTSKYIPTGATLVIDATTSNASTIGVFGGDVFTQKTILRTKIAAVSPVYGVGNIGFQSSIGFYSQNRVNTQMTKRYNNSNSEWIYPNTTLDNWLQGALSFIDPTYNKGYNIINGISSDIAFDPNLPAQSDLPTEIRWSDLKPQNSIVDNFRIFLPLNFKDLPLEFGEIVHHFNFNGELVTAQPRRIQRQYFNTRGTINVGGGADTEAVIGDGSVMSRDGQSVSVIGSSNKWSFIKGKSAQGSDVMYWISTELKKAMRMGYDGTISIADIHGLQSFFANNLTWVSGKDTPADEQGICGVWDDRYMSAIWTVRGMRSVPQWLVGTTYAKGAVVFNKPNSFSVFEKTGEIYISLANGEVGHNPSTGPAGHWFLVPHQGEFTVTFTDATTATHNANEYYNEYTIEFNEQKNKFTTFYTFKPKIYLKWTDTFLTARPISDTGVLCIHRAGLYCLWYGTQTGSAFIELIYNKQVNNSKLYLALWLYGELNLTYFLQAIRIDLTTKRHKTFMLASDFENNLDYFAVPIKNDILTSSNGLVNDEDTSKLFGEYVKIKIRLSQATDILQKLVDVVLKFFSQPRNSAK